MTEQKTDGQAVMKWITLLPEVGQPILERRAAILKTLIDAVEFEKKAAELRAKAYHDSLSLESHARSLWTNEEICRAKQGH